MSEWQPIATAPRDGTVILLFLDPPLDTSYICGWSPARHLQIVAGWGDMFGQYTDPEFGYWHAGLCEEGSADSDGCSSPISIDLRPTHWMPLPDAPV